MDINYTFQWEGKEVTSYNSYFTYTWEDDDVTEDVYMEKLKEVFDVEQSIDPENFESLEDILSRLQM